MKINIKSYDTGLLQAKAYRILQKNLNQVLAKQHLSMPEWALLGQLFDNKNGLGITEIAHILDVEPPFATNLADKLEQKDLAYREVEKIDRRKKCFVITDKGVSLVSPTETLVRERMKLLLQGIHMPEILIYLHVLKIIVKNDKTLEKGGEN